MAACFITRCAVLALYEQNHCQAWEKRHFAYLFTITFLVSAIESFWAQRSRILERRSNWPQVSKDTYLTTKLCGVLPIKHIIVSDSTTDIVWDILLPL